MRKPQGPLARIYRRNESPKLEDQDLDETRRETNRKVTLSGQRGSWADPRCTTQVLSMPKGSPPSSARYIFYLCVAHRQLSGSSPVCHAGGGRAQLLLSIFLTKKKQKIVPTKTSESHAYTNAD